MTRDQRERFVVIGLVMILAAGTLLGFRYMPGYAMALVGLVPLLVVASAISILCIGRPGLTLACSPVLVVVYYSGSSVGVQLYFAVILLSLVGAVMAGGTRAWQWAMIPLGLAGYMALREFADPGGSFAIYGFLICTVFALLAAAAATLAPPPLELFLVAVGVTGALFAWSGRSIGALDDRGQAVMGVNANGVGILAAAGFIAGVAMMLHSQRMLVRIASIGLALANLVGIIVSNSQGALLSIIGALLVIVWYWRRAAIPLVLVVAAGLAYLTLASGFADTLGGIQRSELDLVDSRDTRAVAFEASWALFTQSPLFGTGRDAGIDIGAPTLSAPHSIYTGMLLLGGVFGLALFAIATIAILRNRGTLVDRRLLMPQIALFALLGITADWDWFPYAIIPLISIGSLMSKPRDNRSVQRVAPTAEGASAGPDRSAPSTLAERTGRDLSENSTLK